MAFPSPSSLTHSPPCKEPRSERSVSPEASSSLGAAAAGLRPWSQTRQLPARPARLGLPLSCLLCPLLRCRLAASAGSLPVGTWSTLGLSRWPGAFSPHVSAAPGPCFLPFTTLQLPPGGCLLIGKRLLRSHQQTPRHVPPSLCLAHIDSAGFSLPLEALFCAFLARRALILARGPSFTVSILDSLLRPSCNRRCCVPSLSP